MHGVGPQESATGCHRVQAGRRRRLVRTAVRAPLAIVVLCLVWLTPPLRAADYWILVDTTALTLTVLQDEKPVATHADISIGRNGFTRQKVSRDQRTPLGAYHVSAIRNNSRFHRFIAIDYPSLDDARDALRSGRIDEATFQAILGAHERGQQPPADTPLGGHIGIHGIGTGDAGIHADFHWTDGCIALTNEQIDELTPLITLGMTVVIH